MKIRKAKPEDIEACLALGKGDKIAFTPEGMKSSVKNKEALFLVIEDKSKILGYVIGFKNPALPSETIIQEVRVDKALRNKGIGRQLVEAFCEQSKKCNVKEVLAYAIKESLPFYNKLKFKKSEDQYIEINRQV